MEIQEIFEIIEDLETRESNNSIRFSPILHEARCADRMKVWEMLIFTNNYPYQSSQDEHHS